MFNDFSGFSLRKIILKNWTKGINHKDLIDREKIIAYDLSKRNKGRKKRLGERKRGKTIALLMCLFITIIVGIGLVYGINLLNNQPKESSKTEAPLPQGKGDLDKNNVEKVEGVSKKEAAVPVDPTEEIKARLRRGDTTGIKVIFLTFDDGPNAHTREVLDILKQYEIKGTFFPVLNEGNKESYGEILKEGHTLGNHTASHSYGLYSDPKSFFLDVENLDHYQKQVTGKEEMSHIFRFPGGSASANNTCVQGILDRGYNYADWNVSSGDGSSTPPSKKEVEANIINGCRSFDVSVVLTHAELKPYTKEALPVIIETLKAEGYTFLPMEKDYVYPRQLTI